MNNTHKYLAPRTHNNKKQKRQRCRSSNRNVSVFLFVSMLGELGVSFSVSAFWRSVALGESQQLQHVESIPSAFDILQYVLYAASFSSHTVQGPDEEVFVQLVLVPQDGALLQRHWHGGPVFGAFTAGEADAVEFATNCCCQPHDLHILSFLGLNILMEIVQQSF